MHSQDKESESKCGKEKEEFMFGRFLSNPPPGEEVVITGISGQFPDSYNVNHFRDNLYNKVDMISGDNRRWEDIYPGLPHQSGKIFDIGKFDTGFFGIHYSHAKAMEPGLRLLLERSVEAIIDAGINPSELEGTKTGVYVATIFAEKDRSFCYDHTSISGHIRAMIANTLSYFFKLKGPSFVADTACSSSHFALEQAYHDLRAGRVNMALVGSSNLTLFPSYTIRFAKSGMLSDDGRCRVFDQKGGGYVRSEAVACLFLQKSKDARRIYAQIVHLKTNSDGYTPQSITFPSSEIQAKLLEEFYRECNIKPSSLSYLEAHGTGTSVGDPQELQSIEEVFCKGRTTPLLVGSVKSNIGHTEPVSGICSIIKTIISYENQLIPPNLHYQNPREGVEALRDGRLRVVTESTPFQDTNGLVGISNFGFGGSNAHLLLRCHKKAKVNRGLPEDDLPRLVCVSGRHEEGTDLFLDDLSNRILDQEFIKLCHQIFCKNISGHSYRGYIILSKSGEVKRSSSRFCGDTKQLALVFTNFGNSWSQIAKILCALPLFVASVQSIHDILSTKDVNIYNIVINGKPSKKGSKFDEIIGTAVVQIAVVIILENLEINCNHSFGYGVGRYICRYLEGSFTLEETVLSIYNAALRQDNSKTLQLTKLKRDAIILEIGNQKLDISTKRYHFLSLGRAQSGLVSFLEILGKLYQLGHNFAIDRLYPEVKYPVSRGTPMVSPLLKWNHHSEWFEKFYEHRSNLNSICQRSVSINLAKEEWAYIDGHVIDGRELFPAAGYIDLVWDTFSMIHQQCIQDEMDIIIENIKFLRATTVSKSNTVELTVEIHLGSGHFEVVEHNSIVVTGTISSFKKHTSEQINLPLPLDDESSSDVVSLTSKDVYKELRLRGYNYKGAFRRIVKCNGGLSKALVNWNSNWVTFIDNMLQLKILQMDSRGLFVPTEIKRISIAGRTHLNYVQTFGEDPDLPVYIYKESDIIKCGGIEIRGLMASSIARRKPRGEPVLEKYVFVPNETKLNIKDSIRVVMQLIQENLPGSHVKVTEVIDESTTNSEILSSIVHEVLSDLPLIRPSITLLTNQEIKIPNVTTEDKKLHMETDCTLVIGSNLCQSLMTLNQAFSAVKENGFVLSREPLNLKIQETNLEDFDVLTVHTVNTEKFYLLRKKTPLKYSSIIDITGSNDNFSWLDILQKAIKQDPNVIVVAQNEPLNGILGLVNCIRREPGCLDVKAVFTFKDAPPFDIDDPFYSSQLKKNLSVNIYKNSNWGTYKHLLLDDVVEIEKEHCFVNTLIRGDLSSLKWIEGPLTQDTVLPPETDFVYIYYSALNFKDIMLASGRLSADANVKDRTRLEYIHGFEFSGKTRDGKRVMGMAEGALATVTAADRYILWPCPDFWTLEEAATIPTVYGTVYYAFFAVCDIRKGKSILIHAGSGGVGQAAISVALYYGLTVYTTVGTKEKREFLKKKFPQLEDNNIGNSRDTSFEQMILRETGGRGVDFVLNSLAEEKLLASVRCLASGGHFMEIGKFDLASDNELTLKLLQKTATFHGIMVDGIFSLDPMGKKKLRDLVWEGIKNGAIKPLVRTIFQMEQVEEAFRYMAAGKHIGKVLIQIRKEEHNRNKITLPREVFKGLPRYSSNPNSVQIIVGGLGGFGLELADWLVLRGARNLVLTSRQGVKTGYQSYRIKMWKSYGVRVYISTADITTREGCQQLIEEATNFGPIESIFNLAVVLKDAIFENQTLDSFRQSFQPKAFATKHLDEISRLLCPNLRDFVIFSSVSCGRGNAGQTNYGMANSIMERICERRKEDGLPALAIEWGAVGDVGLVAELQEEHTELEIGGTLQQRISSCLQVLDTLLVQKTAVVSSMVVAEKRGGLFGGDNIVESVAQILGLKNVKTVSPHASLAELGMDSMTGVEIKQMLEREYSVFLTPTDMRKMTFAKLAEIQEARDGKNESDQEDRATKGFDMIVRAIIDEETSKLPIITLKSRVEEKSLAPNIIFIPGIEGVAKSMSPLALNLNGHVKCLQYIHENQSDSIPEMAKTLLPIVENNISNTEPFNIVAYSYGVNIALEIVSILETKGYSGNLFTIDGAPNMLKEVLKNNISVQSETVFETAFLKRLMSVYMSADIVSEHEDKILSCKTFEERINVVGNIIPKNTVYSSGYLKEFITASCKRLKALINYKSSYPKIKSNVMLFKPLFTSLEDLSEDYDLSEICKKPVDVRVFQGNHVTLLDNVEMAEVINNTISENKRKFV